MGFLLLSFEVSGPKLDPSRLPNYIVIGQAKCGTTSLCEALGRHPHVFMTTPKEPGFFRKDDFDHSQRGNAYASLFDAAAGKTMRGEGSTNYTHPHTASLVADRIAAWVPECRIIFMARHPIRRIESDWKMRCFEGWAPSSINEAVLAEGSSLVAHSRYHRNLSGYLKRFDRSKIHIVFLEDFSRDPATELQKCFTFLQVDPTVGATTNVIRNASSDFRRPGTALAILEALGMFESAKKVFPDSIRNRVRGLTTTQVTYEAEWDIKVKQQVIDSLFEDAAAFLKLCNKPSDYWDLKPSTGG